MRERRLYVANRFDRLVWFLSSCTVLSNNFGQKVLLVRDICYLCSQVTNIKWGARAFARAEIIPVNLMRIIPT